MSEQMLEGIRLERGGAEAEELRCEPLISEYLLEDAEILQRLLSGTDTAGGLDSPLDVVQIIVLPYDRCHDIDRLGRGTGIPLAGGGLDEVCFTEEREDGCPHDMLGRLEGTGLEDHL